MTFRLPHRISAQTAPAFLIVWLLAGASAPKIASGAEATVSEASEASQVGTQTAVIDPRLHDAIALLDLWVEEHRVYQEVPGVALAVVADGRTVWSKGYGFRDLATRQPMTPETPLRIGSVTKLFTSTAVLQLRDAGKLDLDDPIARHLPWFSIQSEFAESGPITVRHLLTHTSGLPREGAFPYWTTHVFPSREELRQVLAGQQTVHPPGQTYKYSNLGMSLLGEVVMAVSGESYADYVRRHIFEPLGMRSSSAEPTVEQIAALATAYFRKPATGERRTFEYYDTGAIAPAAAIVSTVEDLARFAALHLRDSLTETGPKSVVAPLTVAEMHQPHFVYPSWTGGRGLGFAISHRDDRTFVSHGGWIGGHRADFILDPGRKIAVVALTNADDASPGFFARKAMDILAPVLTTTAPATVTAGAGATATIDPAWQAYLGTYTDPWDWHYEVLIHGGDLVLYEHNYPPEDDPGASVTRLTPVSEHAFRMGDGELVVFELDEQGKVQRMRRRFEYLLPLGTANDD